MYEGGFKEGKRHGHGYLKQGKLTTGLASMYIGEWVNDKKCGFGILSDILKGSTWWIVPFCIIAIVFVVNIFTMTVQAV